MADLTRFRERLANEPGYRGRALDEIIMYLGDSMGLIDDAGLLTDPDAERRAAQVDPMVGGRPLHHYRGLTEEQVRAAGVDDAGIARIREYQDLAPDDAAATAPDAVMPLTGHMVPDAAVPPADIPETDDEGLEHPDLQAWGAEQQPQEGPVTSTTAEAQASPEGLAPGQTPQADDERPASVAPAGPMPENTPPAPRKGK